MLTSVVAAALASTNPAMARSYITTIDWSELHEQGQLEAGKTVAENWEEELFISNDTDEPMTVTIATLNRPEISMYRYQLESVIRYENVEKPGFLEMWNDFGEQGAFFTRAKAFEGPMAGMYGTSDLRHVLLPFQSDAATGLPQRLKVNVVLPAKGKVWISPMHLYGFTSDADDFGTVASSAWWSDRTSGMLGGILGVGIGIIGAVIGLLSGMARGQRFAVGTCKLVVALGIVSLIAGVVAIATSQPYAVYYPLLLMGIVGTLVGGSVLPGVRNQFARAELRRMEALDAVAE